MEDINFNLEVWKRLVSSGKYGRDLKRSKVKLNCINLFLLTISSKVGIKRIIMNVALISIITLYQIAHTG